VIHAINGVEVDTIPALRSALDRLASNTSVVLQIRARRQVNVCFI